MGLYLGAGFDYDGSSGRGEALPPMIFTALSWTALSKQYNALRSSNHIS